MVLPLVPVTPTTGRRAVGSPWNARRRARHRGADVVDPHLGHAEPERPRDDQRGRAPRDRVRREVVPVAREAGHAEEQRAGRHGAVVVGQAGDLDVVRAIAEQLAQRHRGRESTGAPGRTAGARSARRGARASPHLAGVGLGQHVGLRQRDAVARRHDDGGRQRGEREVGGAERAAAQVRAAVVEPRGDLVEHLPHAVARARACSSSACVRRTISFDIGGSIAASRRAPSAARRASRTRSIRSSRSSMRWYIQVRASGPRWWSKLASSAAASGLR